MKAKIKTRQILNVMLIAAWVVFVGFMIQAGVILIYYVISCFNPEAAFNLYNRLNLYDLRHFDFWHYTLTISLMISISMLKAFASHLAIRALCQVKMNNPFTIQMVRILERISSVLLGIWMIGVVNYLHSVWLLKNSIALNGDQVSAEVILMAALVFVISQIFKRGVEIQSENELTI